MAIHRSETKEKVSSYLIQYIPTHPTGPRKTQNSLLIYISCLVESLHKHIWKTGKIICRIFYFMRFLLGTNNIVKFIFHCSEIFMIICFNDTWMSGLNSKHVQISFIFNYVIHNMNKARVSSEIDWRNA